ncbi:MAG: hypothetical protein E7290_06380 [Lachnospiraceae bacterium]|nr:hypothetical protein [Lachnospiraceae bacterium]
MSGIFGYLQLNSNTKKQIINTSSLKLWNQAYGRDGCDIYKKRNFMLGCCYEDISRSPAPANLILHTSFKYAVIDALIYNRDELLNEYQLSQTFSDEELLLYCIENYGIDSVKNINGDFCGAIYNETDNTLTIFRDHMGIRPLFYYADNEFVVFSTDIRGITSLLQSDIKIDADWIFKTVSGYSNISPEKTEYSNVFCVKPGGYINLYCKDHKLTLEKHTYWQLGKQKIRFSSEAKYQSHLNQLITDSIKRRIDATACHIGAELSGGLDSGVIDILINRLGHECTFFSWSPNPALYPLVEHDERLVIEDICKQENITCNYTNIKQELDADSNLDKTMQELNINIDYNEIDVYRYILPAYVNTLTISHTSQFVNRSGAKIVFTGHGGDEGVSHRCNPYELFYYHEYYHYFRQMWLASAGSKYRILRTLKNCYHNLTQTHQKITKPFHSPIAATNLLNKEFAKRYNEKDMNAVSFAYDPKMHILNGGSRNRLDNISLQGAYSGVRYVIPYLDYRVIDFAVSIPRYLYLKGNSHRHIFREAFKDIMPPSLYTQCYKCDFGRNSAKKDSDWNDIYVPMKTEIVKKLNREYWKQYLDFNVIDEWLNHQDSTSATQELDENIFICLYICAMAQNVLDKTKEIVEEYIDEL